jgi:hypothetical protein
MKIVYQLICLVILGACSSNNPNQVEINPNAKSGRSEYKFNTDQHVKPENSQNKYWKKYSKEILDTPERLAFNFLTWYLDIYNSDTAKLELYAESIDENTIQINDYHFFKKLKGLGYFSESFFDLQMEKIGKCNAALKRLKPPKEYNPAEDIGGDSCSFLLYYDWIGGQGEAFSKCCVIESKKVKNVDRIENRVVFLAVGSADKPWSKTAIYCRFIDNVWQIENIEFIDWIE